ncbi:hypothetical protein ASG36_05100 [Geodermatophilus sp. Leaf369]|uniref:YveK family protein n=1 Tax=Geodermatophilus sp. Leaf369 TaxID=1736354 RepID=UPI0006FED9FC|nr:hypothetical protein [Geodermatophilus sp. Leaf369]KQS60330.1 hypothetical protein ASG36_05100 [Geodermatophilus sp. Leaf369]
MDLSDYVAALRRYWTTWVTGAVLGLLLALVANLVIPTTFSATATVFVSSTVEGTDGSAFVNQRVASYPDVAISQTVLMPVAEDLGLPFAEVRDHVTAMNPVNTSQITVTATAADSAVAAGIANEVARRFGSVVEGLESSGGISSPVSLTVTDPAMEPTSPSEPRTALLVALGLVAGLFLGLAAAVVRSRLDRTVHGELDVRRALAGEWDEVPLLTGESYGTGHPTARVVAELARRVDLMGEDRPARVVLLPPSDDAHPDLVDFSAAVVQALREKNVDALVAELEGPALHVPSTTSTPVSGDSPEPGRVVLSTGSPMAALRTWHALRSDAAGIVVVIVDGGVSDTQLLSVAGVLRAVDITPVAVVLLPRARKVGRRERRRRIPGPSTSGSGSSMFADAPAQPLLADGHVHPDPAPRPSTVPIVTEVAASPSDEGGDQGGDRGLHLGGEQRGEEPSRAQMPLRRTRQRPVQRSPKPASEATPRPNVQSSRRS